MSLPELGNSWRNWFPVPTNGRINLSRWLLLEGNRYAVTAALLTLTFVSIITIGTIWTFEIRQLLTETQAVQSLLNSFLSGIILLVSVVVSINSIVLSYDIVHVGAQEDRIEGMMKFRQQVGRISNTSESPTDPNSFLKVMANVIQEEASKVAEVADGSDEAFAQDIQQYLEQITGTAEHLERSLGDVRGGKFGVLWLGLETDYGSMMNRSRELTSSQDAELSESGSDSLDNLFQALELFATGREYFKTLYYNQEISALSRTLLVVSLPAIVVTASTILAINANLFPEIWMLGLPPLLMFVGVAFTIALTPFLVLTSYMLRVATVAQRTAGAGPFVLRA